MLRSRSMATRRQCLVAVTAGLAVVAGLLHAGPSFGAEAPGSSAGPGAGSGSVNPRSGLLSFELPITTIPGTGAGNVELTWRYRQEGRDAQPEAGLGSGWSWGLPEVVGNDVVFSDGESFRIDPSAHSGLADHRKKDVRFTTFDEPIPAGDPGCAAMTQCQSVLHFADGTRQTFDLDGKLNAIVDKHGNVSLWTWDAAGRLTGVTGGYAESPVTVSVEYSGSDAVTIRLPARADGSVPIFRGRLEGGRLTSVTNAAEETSEIRWADTFGAALPVSWTSFSGSKSEVTYQQVAKIVAVKTLRTVDADGVDIDKPIEVFMDPAGNDGRNYTGYPRYHGNTPRPGVQTTDPLVDSNDTLYTYKVAIGDGEKVTTRTFDHLHREITAITSVDGVEMNTTRSSYPDSAGMWPNVPDQYQLATTIERTIHDHKSATRNRIVTGTYAYDDRGRVTGEELSGIRTETVFDTDQMTEDDQSPGYGLPLSTTRTVLSGPDSGGSRTETAILTDDRTSIARTHSTATSASGDTTDVSETDRTYLPETGEVVEETTTGYAADGSASVSTTRTDRVSGGGRHVTTVTAADGTTTRSVIDAASGATVEETNEGVTTATARDAADRPTRIVTTDADGVEIGVVSVSYETLTHDGISRVTNTRESDGYAKRRTLDLLGRTVLDEDNQLGGSVVAGAWRPRSASEFDERGREVATIDSAGRRTVRAYDHDDRVIATMKPDGTGTEVSYDDAAGTTVTRTLPAGVNPVATVVSTVTTDDDGRVIREQIDYADGTPSLVRTQTYTGFGESAESVDEAAGRSISDEVDAAGRKTGSRIESATEGLLVTGECQLDGRGNRLSKQLTSADGDTAATHRNEYEDGRLVASIDALGQTTRTRYDSRGRIAAVEHPDSRVAHTAYDGAGRIRSTWWMASGSDEPRLVRENSYDALTGQLASVWDAEDETGTRIRYDYLPDGTLAGIHYADGTAIRFAYTDAGELAEITDPHGVTTRFERDGAGRTVTVSTPTATVETEYDAMSRVEKEIRRGADGSVDAVTTHEYDDSDATVVLTHTGADGELLERHRYEYTPAGLVSGISTELGQGIPVPEEGDLAGIREYTTVHEYDGVDRLVRTTISEGVDVEDKEGAAPLRSTTYLVNAASDVVAEVVTDKHGATTTTGFVLDAAGRKTSATVTTAEGGETAAQRWDAAGNLVEDLHGNTYRYDLEGRTIGWTTPEGETTDVTWRADGTRHTLTTSAAGRASRIEEYRLVGDSARLLAEIVTDADDSPTAVSHVHDDTGPAALTTQEGTTWLLDDLRGDITTTLDPDGVTHHDYTDYGTRETVTTRPASAHDQPYGFTGLTTNPGTGNTHHTLRDLVHAAAQFTTKDPTDLLNRHTYAAANPVTNTDPTGRLPQWLNWGTFAISGASLTLSVATIVTKTMAAAAAGAVLPPLLIWLAIDLAAVGIAVATYVDAYHDKFLPPAVKGSLQLVGFALAALNTVKALRTAATFVTTFAKHSYPTTSLGKWAASSPRGKWLDTGVRKLADRAGEAKPMRWTEKAWLVAEGPRMGNRILRPIAIPFTPPWSSASQGASGEQPVEAEPTPHSGARPGSGAAPGGGRAARSDAGPGGIDGRALFDLLHG